MEISLKSHADAGGVQTPTDTEERELAASIKINTGSVVGAKIKKERSSSPVYLDAGALANLECAIYRRLFSLLLDLVLNDYRRFRFRLILRGSREMD